MIDPRQVSCVLITKDEVYPKEILDHISRLPFGEILILTHSDSPYRKHELFAKTRYDLIAYQDDDAICPWKELFELSDPTLINAAIKPGHLEAYKDTRMLMGLGWGSIFPKSLLASLKLYTDKYGEDEVYKRETERALTYLNYPQKRLVLPIQDLPSAMAPDRLWRQSNHNQFRQIMEERCATLVSP